VLFYGKNVLLNHEIVMASSDNYMKIVTYCPALGYIATKIIKIDPTHAKIFA
jgi:hypothetical protein